ncbi:nuclear transport factor 2 family protein [Nonomuraea ferruginea]
MAGGARYSVQAADGTLHGPPTRATTRSARTSAGRSAEQTDTRRHVITNVRVASVAGATSTVAAYLTLMVTVDGVLRPRCTGTYRFVVREEGGELRFDESSVTLDGAF